MDKGCPEMLEPKKVKQTNFIATYYILSLFSIRVKNSRKIYKHYDISPKLK